MSAERSRLHVLVGSLPESDGSPALSFLTESRDEEVLDADTAASLDAAIAEPGDDVSLEEVRRHIERRFSVLE